MRTRGRTRALLAGAVLAAGIALTGTTTATAAPAGPDVGVLDYWQYHDTYPTHDACVAAAQPWLYPTHPGGADDFACEPAGSGSGWDLYLIFAT